MANPADQAAVEDAKFKAALARTDAGNTMKMLTEQTQQYKNSAEQTLSKGMVSLAISGNTGFKDSAAPAMPGAVGATDPEEIVKLKSELPALEQQLATLPQTVEAGDAEGDGGRGRGGPQANPEYSALQAKIADIKDKISVVGTDMAPTISDPSMLLRASGSDLLTMMNTREMMQRDLNTFIRTQKNEAMTMLKNAGNYDKAASYAKQAANYNTMSTILGYGFKIAGLPGIIK
jgi:hypothetical protein